MDPELTGMLLDRPRLPTMLQQALPPPQAGPVAPVGRPSPSPQPQAPQQGPGGFSGFLSKLFAGAPDQSLSAEENEQARKQALLQAGLGILANPGGNPIATIAKGAMAGQSAGTSLRERLKQKNAMRSLMGRLPPEQQAMLRSLPLEQQVEALQKLLTDDGQVVGPGSAVYRGGEQVYINPKTNEPEPLPGDMRGLAWGMGVDLDNATPAERAAVQDRWEKFKASGATRVNVDARPPVEKGMDNVMMAQYQAAVGLAETAQGQLQNLAVADSLLDQGMTTSKLDELTMPLREVAASFGMADAENLNRQQVFRGLSNQMALAAKTGMTGPMSDKDIVFLQRMVPQLGNTVEGNRMMIEVARRVAQRQRARAIEMDKFISEKGTTRGMMSHMAVWDDTHGLDLGDLREMAVGTFADLVPGGGS